MEPIRLQHTGAAVEDVQQRLVLAGFLTDADVDGVYGEKTAQAVNAFCAAHGLPATGEVNEKTWAALVDASYSLGDRTLYLRMPFFHGNDVRQLQQALGALGFACNEDGIFGAYTEAALRKFQVNLALFGDGIAGAQTFRAIYNLRHSWEGKSGAVPCAHLGFSRAADVLEQHMLCLFGTTEFTRSVASRMSNLALATNPNSRLVSADSLLVAPDKDMCFVHLVLPGEKRPGQGGTVQSSVSLAAEPLVQMDNEEGSLALRIKGALNVVKNHSPRRIAVQLPGETWENAGEARAAQHYAVTLLDALCVALSNE
jgi:hypothetical protein